MANTFINNPVSGMKWTLNKFEGHQDEAGSADDTLEDRSATYGDVGGQEKWASRNLTRYYRDKQKAEVEWSHALLQAGWLATQQHCQKGPGGLAGQAEQVE